jgi:hypothetical protein
MEDLLSKYSKKFFFVGFATFFLSYSYWFYKKKNKPKDLPTLTNLIPLETMKKIVSKVKIGVISKIAKAYDIIHPYEVIDNNLIDDINSSFDKEEDNGLILSPEIIKTNNSWLQYISANNKSYEEAKTEFFNLYSDSELFNQQLKSLEDKVIFSFGVSLNDYISSLNIYMEKNELFRNDMRFINEFKKHFLNFQKLCEIEFPLPLKKGFFKIYTNCINLSLNKLHSKDYKIMIDQILLDKNCSSEKKLKNIKTLYYSIREYQITPIVYNFFNFNNIYEHERILYETLFPYYYSPHSLFRKKLATINERLENLFQNILSGEIVLKEKMYIDLTPINVKRF